MRRTSITGWGWAWLDVLTCLLLIVYTLIAPPVKVKVITIPTQGLYAITQTCPIGSPNDIDLYVRDPLGGVAYYANLTSGLMHLEQDIIPGVNDVLNNIKVPIGDDERTVIRGAVPGEYIVDLHAYTKFDAASETCQVDLWSLKGIQQITTAKVTLATQGSVQTAFRFTLNAAGVVTNINHLPRDIVDTAVPGGGTP